MVSEIITCLFVYGLVQTLKHLYFSPLGSAACPQRGCYDCPKYAPGENPFFKERHKQSELIRAKDFMESGEADKYRKVVEL